VTTTRRTETTDGSQTARAEELVDDVTERVDDWSDKVADWVAHATARTREEVEDIWAEAQSVRRRM
jgi:F0F1-type ATP synthase membrane subunit b/b'